MELRNKAVIFLVAISFIFTCNNVFALTRGYNLGPIKIKPSIDVSVEYNSNAELKSQDEEEEFIYKVTPAIDLSFGTDILSRQTRRLYFGVNYNAEASHLEGKDINFTHTVGGVLRYNLSPLTSIGVYDSYRQAPTDLLGGDMDKEYEYNTATASLKHQFSPRLASEVFYTNSFYDSETTDNYDEYTEDLYGVGINYMLSKRLNTRLDVSQGERDFEDAGNEKDYDIQLANLALNYDLTKRIAVGASVGYTERDYSREQDDTENIIYGAKLISKLNNFSTLRLDYSYGILDTYDYPDPLGFVTPFNRQIDVATSIDILYKYLDVERFGANLLYNLTEKDAINLDGIYMKSEASSTQGIGDTAHTSNDLDEDAYMASIGYSRKFTRWFSLGLNVSYGERDSNVRSDYDYLAFGFNTKLAF